MGLTPNYIMPFTTVYWEQSQLVANKLTAPAKTQQFPTWKLPLLTCFALPDLVVEEVNRGSSVKISDIIETHFVFYTKSTWRVDELLWP